jgi:hypothetical protein
MSNTRSLASSSSTRAPMRGAVTVVDIRRAFLAVG